MGEVEKILEEIEKLSQEDINKIIEALKERSLRKKAEEIINEVKSMVSNVMALYYKAKELDDELGAYIEKHWDDEALRNYWYLISTIKHALYSFLNTLRYKDPFKELIEI